MSLTQVPERTTRINRSELSVPASNPRFIDAASRSRWCCLRRRCSTWRAMEPKIWEWCPSWVTSGPDSTAPPWLRSVASVVSQKYLGKSSGHFVCCQGAPQQACRAHVGEGQRRQRAKGPEILSRYFWDATLAATTVALLVLAGCASSPPLAPGTGDVSFRLVWSGTTDLDLHVEDPSGDELSFIQRETRSGGILDIDCNAGPEQLCRRPIENVYWPDGAAPEGTYRYRVEFFRATAGDPTHTTSKEAQRPLSVRIPFELEVRLGDRVVERQTGELSGDIRVAGPYEYEFVRQPRPGRVDQPPVRSLESVWPSS